MSFRADIFNLFNTVNFFGDMDMNSTIGRPQTNAGAAWCSSRGRSSSERKLRGRR